MNAKFKKFSDSINNQQQQFDYKTITQSSRTQSLAVESDKVRPPAPFYNELKINVKSNHLKLSKFRKLRGMQNRKSQMGSYEYKDTQISKLLSSAKINIAVVMLLPLRVSHLVSNFFFILAHSLCKIYVEIFIYFSAIIVYPACTFQKLQNSSIIIYLKQQFFCRVKYNPKPLQIQ